MSAIDDFCDSLANAMMAELLENYADALPSACVARVRLAMIVQLDRALLGNPRGVQLWFVDVGPGG